MSQIRESDKNQSGDLLFREKSFGKLLEEFEASMKRAFHRENDIDRFCSTRGIPPAVLNELMSGNPLSLCIPKQYGGFGGDVKESFHLFLSLLMNHFRYH
jgi:acyl-CoA dehydrogenase